MDHQKKYLQNRTKWVTYLISGLILEVCVIAIAIGIWADKRNENLNSLIGEQITTSAPTAVYLLPQLTENQVTDEADLDEPRIPTNIAQETALATSSVANKITKPNFDVKPPGKIVYTCFDGHFDQICLMNADGSKNRQLTFNRATSFYPSLSPLGDQIIYSSKKDGNFEVYVMDTNGTNLSQISNDIGNLYAPEISPKQNRIIFTNEGGGIQTVWVMKIDGSNARPLVESSGTDIDPTWSPDASQIAFTSRRDGINQLYIANSDGSKPTSITPKWLSVGGRSSWSPDGSRLVFYAGERSAHQIYQIDHQDGDLIQLTQTGDNLGPSYSPDGKWVTFTSFRDGNNEIYILHLESKAIYRLTNRSYSDWQPRWGN
jgi:Tol biopolymer transport system component